MQKSYDNRATLYLVPTPIGNLQDITERALSILSFVDFILCEDTRVSYPLLRHYNISKRLVSCHEFNEDKIKDFVLNELNNDKNIALITDQGSPIISDPGYLLCKYIIQNGYNVVGLPGATAFVPALISSGINANHFLYYGFLNIKSSKQKNELESLKKFPYTLIFYEAPHRIIKTLSNMLEVFGDRYVSISREISKVHEEIVRGPISSCLKEMKVIKGEYVLVVSGCEKESYYDLSILSHIKLYLSDGMDEMQERGVAKSIIYKEYLEEKEK